MPRIPLLNIEIDDITLTELLERFDAGVLVTPNLDHLLLLQQDSRLRDAYRSAAFVTVDSQILFWALRLLGRPVRAKLSGSDILPAYCAFHADRARRDPTTVRRMFILGGRPGVAERAARAINDRVGAELIIGSHGPSMRFVDDRDECDRVVQAINESSADVLIVGLGAPKQELWIAEHRDRMPQVLSFLAVGAAIDFEAGTVSRAPAWMSKSGLEWAYRLFREPKRLWRRYLVRGPAALLLLWREYRGVYRDPFACNASR